MRKRRTIDLPKYRSADDQRLIDLTIVGILPRCWPQYSYPDPNKAPTFGAVLEAVKDERLPWEISIEAIEQMMDRTPKSNRKPH